VSDCYAIPYPPIECLGVVGDRRTAALVAADGTVCWLCLPNYDDAPVFAALLDATKGGLWRIGPPARRFGTQSYVDGTPCLETRWEDEQGGLTLTDMMAFPGDRRGPRDESRRVLIRHVRCTRGRASVHMTLSAVGDVRTPCRPRAGRDGTVVFEGHGRWTLWCSAPLRCQGMDVVAAIDLSAGQDMWCVFGPAEHEHAWSAAQAAAGLQSAKDYWLDWLGRLNYDGACADAVKRSAMLVHLLTFAPDGAVVASVSACLPERIGGRRNYDYRFAWIRDASLGLALLARLGRTEDAQRFMDWLSHRRSETDMPLQILYRINGGADAELVDRDDIDGYRMSRPVRFGNRAAAMRELGSYGFLIDCAFTYLRHGGRWKEEYWQLVSRLADYTAATFMRPDASIWEIETQGQYVATKVMCWLALDRAVRIAGWIDKRGPFVEDWEQVRDLIRDEVLDQGWSPGLGSFRQRYGCDTLDAALLLIPLSGLLPVDDPRVTATMDEVVDRLGVNGFLQRFVPHDVAGNEAPPLVEAEGAFLMCTFWLAQLLARRGECARAEAILRQAEASAGPLGIFSEAVDARTGSLLGNTPLLFSHVEYANALMALSEAQQRSDDGSGGATGRLPRERGRPDGVP
jgi:GH15 family glucan-1,4-alpha-glucosidase